MHVGFRVQLNAKVRWGGGGASESCTLGLREALHRSQCLTVKRSGSVRRYRAGAKQSIAQKVDNWTPSLQHRVAAQSRSKLFCICPTRYRNQQIRTKKKTSSFRRFFSRRTDRENQPDGSCGHTKLINMVIFYS